MKFDSDKIFDDLSADPYLAILLLPEVSDEGTDET
jgi:hypothetical protein